MKGTIPTEGLPGAPTLTVLKVRTAGFGAALAESRHGERRYRQDRQRRKDAISQGGGHGSESRHALAIDRAGNCLSEASYCMLRAITTRWISLVPS